jgi:hypothetical protein
MSEPSMTPRTKPQPVLIILSAMATLQVLVGGAALTDVIGNQWAGFLGLLLAALQTGMAFYLRGQVVPLADTAAFLNDDRHLVAGPAADGQRSGDSVRVIAPDTV